MDLETVAGGEGNARVGHRQAFAALVNNHLAVLVLLFLRGDILGVVADGDDVDLPFLGVDRIQPRREDVVLNAGVPRLGLGIGVVGQIGLHADVTGRNLHPAGMLELVLARVGDLGLDDGGLVGIGIDAIAARPEDAAEGAFLLRVADVAGDEELAFLAVRALFAQHAVEVGDFAGMDHHVVDEVAFPPDRAIEVPARPAELFQHAHFAFRLIGELADLGLLRQPGEDQRSLVAQLQALAFGDVNAVHGPLEGLVADQGHDHQENDRTGILFHDLGSLVTSTRAMDRLISCRFPPSPASCSS